MKSINESEKKDNNDNGQIDLGLILRFILRNKKIFILSTLLASAFSVIYTNYQKPIYRGSFQIVVEDNNNRKDISNSLLLPSLNLKSNDNKTQEFILNSPSVLKPVFNFAKSKYAERGQNIDDLSYKKWSDNNLNIEFEVGTKVLTIYFKDQNKNLILETLNLMSNRYKAYSKRDREKELNNTKIYLQEQQKVLKEMSIKSLKELNSFSIENGLGDVDGFLSLGNQRINGSNTEMFLNNTKKFDTDDLKNIQNFSSTQFNENKAGQRFSKQFALLEQYESQYIDLSSKLKANSYIMKKLNSKIETLREALKRPNEILIKYRELVKFAQRDEALLNQIENELIVTELEIAKQKDPWELISDPTISDGKVSPSLKKIGLQSLILAFLVSIVVSLIRENKLGKIYELDTLNEKIKCDFIATLYTQNKDLIFDEIKSLLKITSNKKDKLDKTCLIDLNKNTSSFLENIIDQDEKFVITNFENYKNAVNAEKFAFLITKDEITKNDILKLNQFANIHNEKLIGWFYLDNNKYQ